MLLVQPPGFGFRESSSPYLNLQTASVLIHQKPRRNRNTNTCSRLSKLMLGSGGLFRGGGSRGRPAGGAAAAATDDSDASEAGMAAGTVEGEHIKMIMATF